MPQQLELVKIVCTSVVAVRENDRIVAELEGQPTACYSLEQMQEYFSRAETEVEQQNAAANGNRSQRRSRKQVPAE